MNTLKIIASFFIITTAVLLILLVLDVVEGQEIKETLLDLAAISGIIAVTTFAISFLDKTKSE